MERHFPYEAFLILQVSYFMPCNIHKVNESVLGSLDQCFDLPCKDWRSWDEFEHIGAEDGSTLWIFSTHKLACVVKTLTTIPTSSCCYERSSAVRRLKPWLRNSTSQNQLKYLYYMSRSLCERKQHYQAVWCIRSQKNCVIIFLYCACFSVCSVQYSILYVFGIVTTSMTYFLFLFNFAQPRSGVTKTNRSPARTMYVARRPVLKITITWSMPSH